MDHIHGSYESTNRFRINPFSRQIINESEIDIVIAQYDHNSERFIFELPKVVEEHDMMLCSAIRIHYINAGSNGKANKDVYEVTDLAVSEDDSDTVTFSWLLSKGATSLDGVLSFAIQFVCTTDGEVDYSWSTLPFKSIKIPETYDNSEDVIIEDYSDILEQWKEELFASFEDFSIDDYYTKVVIDKKFENVEPALMQKISLVGITTLNREWSTVESLTDDSFYLSFSGIVTIEYQGYAHFKLHCDYSAQLIVDGKLLDSNEYIGFIKNNIVIDGSNPTHYGNHSVEFYGIPGAVSKTEINSKLNTNALKASASGEVIRVDDVSAVEHKASVKVAGKNMIPLFPDDYTITRESLTQSCEAGGQTITINGTGNSNGGGRNNFRDHSSHFFIEKGKTYTLSQEMISGTCDGVYSVYISRMTDYSSVIFVSNTETSKTFVAEETVECYIGINVTAETVYDNTVVRFQLEEGNTATEYTPYVDPTTVTVTSCGKNLVNYPYSEKTVTRAGITYTVSDDGSITANGTSTGSYFNVITTVSNKLYLKAGVTYRLSGVPINNKNCYTYAKDASGTNYFDYGEGASFIPKMDGYGAVTIVVTEGSSISNVNFKPQIEVGTTTTDYELHKGSTYYTPASDGTVEIDSVAPTMTVLTDKSGVNIDLEYQQDHNMAMDDVRTDIQTLDNSVASLTTTVGDIEAVLDAIIANQEAIIGGETV